MLLKPRQNNAVKLSVFKPPKPDIFDEVELDPEDKLIFSPEVQAMIASEVRRAVAQIRIPEAKETPPQIIRETRVEVVREKKDTRELVEKSALDAAMKRIGELEKKLEETDRVARIPNMVPGGPGVIGIPPPEPATEGYVLTRNAHGKAEWKASGGSGAGLSGYTVNNGVELKSFDAENVSIDELAKVVGSIIDDLQA